MSKNDFSNSLIVSIKSAVIKQEEKIVLKDVNFDINKGEFVYLIGSTGSGKSSLLKILYADLALKTGEASVAGFNLRTLKSSEVPFLRRKIGIVFQDFQLLTDRTVAENLLFVMKATGWSDKSKMKQRMNDVLMRVGLSSSSSKYPHQLSGGEQQRVVIARALINEPVLLLADEPTGNLDPLISEEVIKLFIEINKSGTAILMATHNHQFLNTNPRRVIMCDSGIVTDLPLETERN